VVPVDLTLESTIEADWAVVEVTGELDLHTAPQLRERLSELTAEGHDRVLLDCSKLTFMDSTGLGVLVGHLKRTRERGHKLALAGLRAPVMKILTITGLDELFPTHPSREDAMRAEA
jgi:anti-sigma B factor antagonist